MKVSSKDLRNKVASISSNKQVSDLVTYAKTSYLKQAQEDSDQALWINAGKEGATSLVKVVALNFVGIPPIVSVPLLGIESAIKQRASLRVGELKAK